MLKNIRWGISWGIGFVVFYSCVAIIIYLLGGSEAFETNDVGLLEIIIFYSFGGIAGGAVLGLLRPLTRRRWGAMIVGAAVAVPIFAGFLFIMAGPPWSWERDIIISFIIGPLLLGPFYAFFLWEPPNKWK